jgi:hypothetical protein
MSKLQAEYGDRVRFVGISDEAEETVKKFLDEPHESEVDKTWRDVVTYTLALDKEQGTNTVYMLAAKQMMIPTAFIVGKQGQIEWIGPPMLIDDVLPQIVGGTWDRSAFAEQFRLAQQQEMLMQELSAAFRFQDWDRAFKALEPLLAANPDNPEFVIIKAKLELNAKRYPDAVSTMAKVADGNWTNHQLLNALAWTIMTEIPAEHRDLKQAMRIAGRANELTGGKDSSILETVAKGHFLSGDITTAIEVQKAAVEVADGEEIKKDRQTALDIYIAAGKEKEAK